MQIHENGIKSGIHCLFDRGLAIANRCDCQTHFAKINSGHEQIDGVVIHDEDARPSNRSCYFAQTTEVLHFMTFYRALGLAIPCRGVRDFSKACGEPEYASVAGLTLQTDLTSKQFDQMLANGQP